MGWGGRSEETTGGYMLCMRPSALQHSDMIFRKDHRNCDVLDVVEVLVETGDEAEFCILG